MRRRISEVRRGEIRWLRFARSDKRRPVLILGPDRSLSAWSQIPIIPFSSKIRGLPWEVRLSVEDGLDVESVLKPEWIRSVDRASIGPRISALPEHRWMEVKDALLLALGFPAEVRVLQSER